eukprot:m.1711 g.1711  ORF g.1711 m.1711 type:complete len:1810 (+) comp7753_c0_seq1:180-5609(+)
MRFVVVGFCRSSFLFSLLVFVVDGQSDPCSACKKPGGTRTLIENLGDESMWKTGRFFCPGAAITFLCSHNRVLQGPAALLRTQRGRCTLSGWVSLDGQRIDMTTVKCQETVNPDGGDSEAVVATVFTVRNDSVWPDNQTSPPTELARSTEGVKFNANGTETSVSTQETAVPSGTSDQGGVTAPLEDEEHEWDVEGYDGWYNNIAHPDWGAAEMPLTRKSPPAYSDGVYQLSGADRPNPLAVSERVFKGSTGERSYRNRTVLLTFFGQQVVEEVLDAQRPGCPPEYENIAIPSDHPYASDGFKNMPFLRSRYDMKTGYSPNVPREQLNEITPWIDGNLFYGTTRAWADALRSFSNGSLACEDTECLFPRENGLGLPMANPPPPRDHALKSAKRFNMLGNPRGNENPFVLTFGILWFREHNRHARRLTQMNPSWSDEKIFNRARQWVIAEHQKIVVYDWLPEFLGRDETESYRHYDSSVHPGIAHEFQSAAMRFGHTLVPPGVVLRHPDCRPMTPPGNDTVGVRTCNSYWIPQETLTAVGIEPVLLGMATQVTEREDNVVTEDLRGKVFGPLEFSRRDLMALNIQRGRDHGLPDYNTVRLTYNLPQIDTWTNINKESLDYMQEAIAAAKEVYDGDINKLDLWTGGLLETTTQGPGELFQAIISDQFLRIRNGDWYWFENERNKLFDAEEIEIIRNTTLKDIITGNTNIQPSDIQHNVFVNRFDDPSSPCHYDFQLNQQMMAPCTNLETFDYFDGSAGPYIGVLTSIGLFVVGLFCLLYLLSYVRRSARPQSTKPRRVPSETMSSSTDDIVHGVATVRVIELKSECGDRPVLIFIRTQPQKEIVLTNDNSKKLRSISLSVKEVELQQASNDVGLLLLRVPGTYDVLVRFSNRETRDFFTRHLNRQLQQDGVAVKTTEIKRQELLAKAVTKRRRQKIVAKFLKEVFKEASQVGGNGNDHGEDGEPEIRPEEGDTRRVLDCSLTREEFAESMSSNPESLFVDQMFRLADKDGDGAVTFREFLNLIVMFSSGGVERKLRLMFDLYDTRKENRLHREPFKKMFVAMMEMVNASVNDGDLNRLCDAMFQSSGLQEKNYLTFDDFKELMGGHKAALADLSLPGSASPHMKRKQRTSGGASLGSRLRTKLTDFARSPRRWNSSTEEAPKEKEDSTSPPEAGERTSAKSSLETLMKATLSLDLTEENKKDDERAKKEGASVKKGVYFEETPIYRNLQELAQAYSPLKEQPPLVAKPPPSMSILLSPPVRKPNSKLKTLDHRQSSISLQKPQSWLQRKARKLRTLIANYKRQIFLTIIYQLVTVCIFVERAYNYSFEREHSGLRRIAGYGVTVTRGAASAMMFTYSTLLLTMCRNAITHLRSTQFNEYIPFDSFHLFHRQFAMTALFYTAIHIVGHAINFYHISTQPADDLTCLFREVFHTSDQLPKFQYWLFGTLTGVTAVLLTAVTAVIFVFATPYARRHVFNAFWITHRLYIVFYILMILHGAGRLVQAPIFYLYFVGPVCAFIIDRLISSSRDHVRLAVTNAELLPSGVTCLKIKKPRNFEYKSGQWVRIACLAQGQREFHPFTLTSAPHEESLSLHIRAVGPWTSNLRNTYDRSTLKDRPFPKLYLDGPFGEGHQDWYKFEVAVMVGGGIGVTPFASILKDIVRKKEKGGALNCKKCYFVWVTRTQRQFEWMTDIIREVEEQDDKRDGKSSLIDVHIFITQFYNKFDLRTTMLYVCERHFQRFYNRSLFTGLRAITHFGRPEFDQFLNEIKVANPLTKKIGVFSCGPLPMTGAVKSACSKLNEVDGPEFVHHYENF